MLSLVLRAVEGASPYNPIAQNEALYHTARSIVPLTLSIWIEAGSM